MIHPRYTPLSTGKTLAVKDARFNLSSEVPFFIIATVTFFIIIIIATIAIILTLATANNVPMIPRSNTTACQRHCRLATLNKSTQPHTSAR